MDPARGRLALGPRRWTAGVDRARSRYSRVIPSAQFFPRISISPGFAACRIRLLRGARVTLGAKSGAAILRRYMLELHQTYEPPTNWWPPVSTR